MDNSKRPMRLCRALRPFSRHCHRFTIAFTHNYALFTVCRRLATQLGLSSLSVVACCLLLMLLMLLVCGVLCAVYAVCAVCGVRCRVTGVIGGVDFETHQTSAESSIRKETTSICFAPLRLFTVDYVE